MKVSHNLVGRSHIIVTCQLMFAFSCPVGSDESLMGHYRETEFSDRGFGGWFKIMELDLLKKFGSKF